MPMASEADIRLEADGELRLSGVLDYRSGPALRLSGQALIRKSPQAALVVDCSGVQKSSSVGLSLLLAFLRDAVEAGKTMSFRGLPSDMSEIARVSGLTEIFTPQA
jgi:phospholipid transport system transporter-binding protein